MVKQLLLAVAAIGLGLASVASADAAPLYLKAEVGTTYNAGVDAPGLDVDLADGAVYGAAVGTAIGPFRVEAGVRNLNGEAFLGAVDVEALDINATAYLDFNINDRSSVFVGAGADYIDAEAELLSLVNFREDGYGWHVAAGYGRRVSEGVIVEAEARYLEADLNTVDFTGATFTVAARFRL